MLHLPLLGLLGTSKERLYEELGLEGFPAKDDGTVECAFIGKL